MKTGKERRKLKKMSFIDKIAEFSIKFMEAELNTILFKEYPRSKNAVRKELRGYRATRKSRI